MFAACLDEDTVLLLCSPDDALLAESAGAEGLSEEELLGWFGFDSSEILILLIPAGVPLVLDGCPLSSRLLLVDAGLVARLCWVLLAVCSAVSFKKAHAAM